MVLIDIAGPFEVHYNFKTKIETEEFLGFTNTKNKILCKTDKQLCATNHKPKFGKRKVTSSL